MHLRLRFALFCAVLLLCCGIGMGLLMSRLVENDMINRARYLTGQYISSSVRYAFRAEELNAPVTGSDYERVSEIMKRLLAAKDIKRIKIWKEDTVIWCDDPSLIGKEFPGNDELEEAFAGETVSELSNLEKAENVSERQFGRLLELYVPVTFEGQVEPQVVAEVYVDLAGLDAQKEQHQAYTWMSIAATMLLIFGATFGVFMHGERLLHKLQGELMVAERAKASAQMARSIGHELSNVVTGISGIADLLQADPDDAAQVREYAPHLVAQAKRLKLHAQDLLAIGSTRKPSLNSLDLRAALDSTYNLLSGAGVIKFAKVLHECSGGPLAVKADVSMLDQVISNLLINASHACQRRGALRISTSAGRAGFAEFSIADSGPGVPHERREHIFETGFTTKGAEGSGLGLHVVKQIVDQHGGYISIGSGPEGGAMFTIGLRLAD